MSMSPMVQKEAIAGATAKRGPVQQRSDGMSPSAPLESGNVQAVHAPATSSAEHILVLQRLLDNRAVQRRFTGAVQQRPVEEGEETIQQEAARRVQTTAARLPHVVQRTRYRVTCNAQRSRRQPNYPINEDTGSSLSVADYNFVDEHRWAAEGFKEKATAEQMGEGKGPTGSLTYLGKNIHVRYDMKKNKHGIAVYPRAHVMGKDIKTQEMWELVDRFEGHDLDLFLKGVRGEVDVNPEEIDIDDELGIYDPKTAGIQVRALLLASDTVDFSTEDYTAKLLSRVTDASTYKRLFRGDTWEPSYGAAVSQNTNTSTENSNDRISVYNTFGEFIWGHKTMTNDILTDFDLELDDSTKSHIPLFRKLKVMLSMVPDLFTITGPGDTVISAANFIQIGNEVILRARMAQEEQFRNEERNRDIMSDDEDDDVLEERLQAVSPDTIQQRLERFYRLQESLGKKINQYEEILRRKTEEK